ncbi:unnamed protein product [Pedinophyceae sp. YPF-701]|nr:unnamed protein product [Pedinophyceae sp. YPF-701]
MGSSPLISAPEAQAISDAVAAKKKGHKAASKGKAATEMDRHSRSGKGSGKAKKGGAGGKYTWEGSHPLSPVDAVQVMDRDDPNYDSQDADAASTAQQITVSEFKQRVSEIIHEYFNSGDVEDVALSLAETALPRLMHHFVKRLVSMSLDKKARECEMASVLLSSLYGEVLAVKDIQKGFLNLARNLGDLTLDIPNAPQGLSLFVARAIVDDVLAPSFVEQIRALQTDGTEELARAVASHLKGKHSAERLARCWGAGAGTSYEETQAAIRKMLEEYANSADLDEAQRCLRELHVPFFHHHVVKLALTRAAEDARHAPAMRALLACFAASGLISDVQLASGVRRVVDRAGDLELDVPGARARLAAFLADARRDGWLDSDLAQLETTPSDAMQVDRDLEVYKQKAEAAVREYFAARDVGEVSRCLADMGPDALRHLFVKRAVTVSMDRGPKERECVSTLLSELFPDDLSRPQIFEGFRLLLDAADDLALDIPDAPRMLALFIARAVYDEVLAPSFLHDVVAKLPERCRGLDVVQDTIGMLAQPRAGERIESCWGVDAAAINGVVAPGGPAAAVA